MAIGTMIVIVVIVLLLILCIGIGVKSGTNGSVSAGRVIRSGKTNLLIVDELDDRLIAHSHADREFEALDKLLLDEEYKMSNCTTSDRKSTRLNSSHSV